MSDISDNPKVKEGLQAYFDRFDQYNGVIPTINVEEAQRRLKSPEPEEEPDSRTPQQRAADERKAKGIEAVRAIRAAKLGAKK